ncbi:MAG: LysE family transporter [Desulfuromonadales bacterium]|nr:LysE family transporter [Desulfuromonadales bacterium]
MSQYLVFGIVLGLSAGFSPGPLMTLVVAESLQRGASSGVKVALAPLVTDLPIVLIALLLLSRLADFRAVLGVVSLTGGVFLVVLGWQSLKFQRLDVGTRTIDRQPLLKGVLTNFLSPHPYLFWLSVGGPLTTRAWEFNAGAAGLFIGGFYACLVGAKIILAVMTAKSKKFLSGVWYARIIRGLGLLLIVLAGLLFYDGLKLLGWTF